MNPKREKIKNFSNIDSLVSQRLKQRRLMLGLSLKETGEMIGVSPLQVKKYEELLYSTSNSKLTRLRQFLRGLIDSFLTRLTIIFQTIKK